MHRLPVFSAARSGLPALRFAAIVLTGGACVASAGCSEAPSRVPVFPAKGSITFKGQPIPGALVTLNPKAPAENVPTPRANVGKDGAFVISTFEGGDGAPAGDYVVTVKWYRPIKQGADVVAGPNVIPPKYGRPETSDKLITIAAGDNNLAPISL
jgi:hypothetical protein